MNETNINANNNANNNIAISKKQLDEAAKKLVQILRHQATDYNLNMDEKGFVELNEILNHSPKLKEFKNINIDNVIYIVETNKKKRLELEIKDNIYYIRATQGHNENVGQLLNDDLALVKMELSSDNKFFYHGTNSENIPSILENGLNKMNRKHIHFVETLNETMHVSGFRSSSDAIVTINMNECINAGMKFYKSSNNVILTEGINGIIPKEYIVR